MTTSWAVPEPEDVTHFLRCEQQPAGEPCICDEIADELAGEDEDRRYDEMRDRPWQF